MKSIRTQLFLIMVILAIVPMLVVGLSSMAIADNSLHGLTLSMMDNHARDIMRRSEDRISYLEQGFTEFSTNLGVIRAVQDVNYDFDIQKTFTADQYTFLLSRPEVTSLLIIREDLTVFGYNASDFSPYAKPGRTFRESIFTPVACFFMDTFIDEFASPTIPFYLSSLTSESTALIICHRIRDPDTYEPIAVMVAHINFLESPSLFDNITLWPEEEIVLLRRDGTVLASTHKELVGEKRRTFAADATTHKELQADGLRYSYSGIQGSYGIEIQVKVPDRVLQETNRRQLLLLATILLLTAGLLAVSFFLIKRRFFGKLGSLSRTLRQREQSPLQPIEGEWGNDEIGELVDNYNIVTGQAREQFHRERERLERLKELELAALQSQIKPHFLYNTLDVGVWYAKEIKAEKIQNLLINLSRYYRLSLSSGAGLITIRDELHHAMLYLEMERLRMSRPLEVIVEIPPDMERYYIDKITLQPIVENCIKHGIKASSQEEGVIAVTGRFVENHIELLIDDNGVGMSGEALARILAPPEGGEGGHGFAVVNVHRRLSLRYGPEYGLRYLSSPGIGTSVRVILPRVINADGGVEAATI